MLGAACSGRSDAGRTAFGITVCARNARGVNATNSRWLAVCVFRAGETFSVTYAEPGIAGRRATQPDSTTLARADGVGALFRAEEGRLPCLADIDVMPLARRSLANAGATLAWALAEIPHIDATEGVELHLPLIGASLLFLLLAPLLPGVNDSRSPERRKRDEARQAPSSEHRGERTRRAIKAVNVHYASGDALALPLSYLEIDEGDAQVRGHRTQARATKKTASMAVRRDGRWFDVSL